MPQSWVCLIAGIELNVLFVWFPADTRHQLRDERPLLPQPSTPWFPPQTFPWKDSSPPTEAPGGYLGTGRAKVAFGPPSHPSLKEFSPKWGNSPQRIMALWMGS